MATIYVDLQLRQQSTNIMDDVSPDNQMQLETTDPPYDEDLEETDGETFEIESGLDHEHFILCNKRIDYQMRSPLLGHVSLYSFFAEYRKAKMTLQDRISLGFIHQSTMVIARGRPPNDRWLFHSDHPQHSTHLIIRRSFAVIPVLVGPAIPRCDREDTAERYARAILTLFCPWTTMLDLCQLDETWAEALERLQTTFTTKSNKIISNIQLLHECKHDRDNDLFQLVNQAATPCKEKKFSQPYIDTGVDDIDELLNFLDTNLDPRSSLCNDPAVQCNSAQARIKHDYLDSIIAHIIHSNRFSYIKTSDNLGEYTRSTSFCFTDRINDDQQDIRKATNEDWQISRTW